MQFFKINHANILQNSRNFYNVQKIDILILQFIVCVSELVSNDFKRIVLLQPYQFMKLTPRINQLKPPIKLRPCHPYYAKYTNDTKQRINFKGTAQYLDSHKFQIQLTNESNPKESTIQNYSSQNKQKYIAKSNKFSILLTSFIRDLQFCIFSQCLTKNNSLFCSELFFNSQSRALKQFNNVRATNCKKERYNGRIWKYKNLKQNKVKQNEFLQEYVQMENKFNQLVQQHEENQYLMSQLQWKLQQLKKETNFKICNKEQKIQNISSTLQNIQY